MGEVELHCAKHLFDKSRLRFAAKISTLPSDVVPKFLHGILDDLCDLNGVEGKKAAADALNVTIEEMKPLIDCYHLFFRQIIRHNLQPQQIEEDLKLLKVGEESIKPIINAVVARRFTAKAAASRNTSKISSSYLCDFDWKIHLNLGSDKISGTRRGSVLLSLVVHNAETRQDEETLLELSPADLAALISRLRNLHSTMVQLRT